MRKGKAFIAFLILDFSFSLQLEQWVRVKVQFPLKQQQASERQRLLQIRREYTSRMFAEQIKRVQYRYLIRLANPLFG